ncbi:MAG: hypothetical protein ABSE69_09800 [Roseiarcus sp.]|jgi:hypothetical protein
MAFRSVEPACEAATPPYHAGRRQWPLRRDPSSGGRILSGGYGGNGRLASRPVYDAYGDYFGQRAVAVC